jgi:hypothetical protein
VAEIRIERKQRGALPWLIGLALVALVVIGLTLAFADSEVGSTGDGAREVGNVQKEKQEQKKKEKEVPRRLQQWALSLEAGPEAAQTRAA